MRVCVPTWGNDGLDDVVCEHFGRAPTFTIVDMDNGDVVVIPNRGEHMGGRGHPPEFLIREGVDVVICQGLGVKAIQTLKRFGVDVYLGASGSVKDSIEMWRRGLLKLATDMDGCRR
ncbi:dinitrogenase iron-molybdenum cofactor biosynthesis protein [Methanosarcinales archaeon]|nr:MAG: dinitrogenase iron-molybdenum cofactor biosynthesis protein [Methanosarcinales archaeon]